MLTTIQMDSNIRHRLRSLGIKGETYTDVIVRLMDLHEDAAAEAAMLEGAKLRKKT